MNGFTTPTPVVLSPPACLVPPQSEAVSFEAAMELEIARLRLCLPPSLRSSLLSFLSLPPSSCDPNLLLPPIEALRCRQLAASLASSSLTAAEDAELRAIGLSSHEGEGRMEGEREGEGGREPDSSACREVRLSEVASRPSGSASSTAQGLQSTREMGEQSEWWAWSDSGEERAPSRDSCSLQSGNSRWLRDGEYVGWQRLRPDDCCVGPSCDVRWPAGQADLQLRASGELSGASQVDLSRRQSLPCCAWCHRRVCPACLAAPSSGLAMLACVADGSFLADSPPALPIGAGPASAITAATSGKAPAVTNSGANGFGLVEGPGRPALSDLPVCRECVPEGVGRAVLLFRVRQLMSEERRERIEQAVREVGSVWGKETDGTEGSFKGGEPLVPAAHPHAAFLFQVGERAQAYVGVDG